MENKVIYLVLYSAKKELPMRDMRIINKRTGKISICVFLAAAAAAAAVAAVKAYAAVRREAGDWR